MKIDDVKIGEEYAVTSEGGFTAKHTMRRARVLGVKAPGEDTAFYRNSNRKLEVELLGPKTRGFWGVMDAGSVVLVTGREVLGPWAEFAEEITARDEAERLRQENQDAWRDVLGKACGGGVAPGGVLVVPGGDLRIEFIEGWEGNRHALECLQRLVEAIARYET